MAFTESQLSEEKKLVWAGLRRAQQDRSEVVGEFNKLRNNVGEYSVFKADLDALGIDNYTEFKTYLTDNGFTSAEADAFIQKIQNNFTDTDSSGTSYDEFEDKAESVDSYSELKNAFGSNTSLTSTNVTETGEPVAGIRILEGGGTTYAGIDVNVTTTEIFGRRVEFSQTPVERSEAGTINYTNIQASPSTADVGGTITISVDVENTNDRFRFTTATLTLDGEVEDEQYVFLDAFQTRTITFEVTKSVFDCFTAQVDDSPTTVICWAPVGLVLP